MQTIENRVFGSEGPGLHPAQKSEALDKLNSGVAVTPANDQNEQNINVQNTGKQCKETGDAIVQNQHITKATLEKVSIRGHVNEQEPPYCFTR